MQKAAVPDFHEAIGQDMGEEPVEKLDNVAGEGSWACTARLTIGDGDGAVVEAHDAAVGDGAPEDLGGEGGEGRVALGIGLSVDVPGDGPDLWIDVLSQPGAAHVFLEERAGEGREGFHRDKEVGSRGSPGRAVLGEATARHDGVDGGVVLELSAPGRQDPGKPRESGADEPLGLGEALEGERRGVEHRVGREALMRAEKGAEGLGDGKGAEKVRPGQLSLQVVRKPLLGFLRLALGTGPVATGMLDAVLFLTVWALREAMAIGAAAAVLDSAENLTV
jgi:hypothetical protein